MGYEIVVIGASRGGMRALATLLSVLPRELGGTVVAVLHRGEGLGDELIRFLQSASVLPVREAEDKDDLRRGVVYVAPPGYHLLLEKGGLALSTEGPVSWARPSIDVLFESAADAWGERVIGVVLTGTNADGAQGLARIKRRGGLTVVQAPSEAECPGMPEAAIAASAVDHVLPLAEIPALLSRLCPDLNTVKP
jgi:two-component system chemotaxis response regulator CheB